MPDFVRHRASFSGLSRVPRSSGGGYDGGIVPLLVPLFVSAAAGYLLGTIPSADMAASVVGGPDLEKVDLRKEGTGNPGAANAAAVLGAKVGFAVLAADISKGAVAGRLGNRLGGQALAQVASTAAVVGHCFPVWTGFKGGKGVATSVGQVLATFPAYFPIDAGVAVATAALPWWKQRTFAATATASAAWVASSWVWSRRTWPNLWGPTPSISLPIGATVSSAVVLSRFIAASRKPPAHPTDNLDRANP